MHQIEIYIFIISQIITPAFTLLLKVWNGTLFWRAIWLHYQKLYIYACWFSKKYPSGNYSKNIIQYRKKDLDIMILKAYAMEQSKDQIQFNSVQFSHSVMSNSLWSHESQHARPPCLSPTPRVHSNSHPSSPWCHPAISSSVVPFSSCPQSLPASESFPMSQLFAWGCQSTGVSALASFLPKNTQGWSLEWTGWMSLQSKGLSRIFSNTTVQKHQFFGMKVF